jgi:hypothetical protein
MTLQVARRIQDEKDFANRQAQFFAPGKAMNQEAWPRYLRRFERSHRLLLHAYAIEDLEAV